MINKIIKNKNSKEEKFKRREIYRYSLVLNTIILYLEQRHKNSAINF
jgi:hypothetical protein